MNQFLNQDLPPFINAVFQYTVAALLTPVNVVAFLGVFVFLSAVFSLIAYAGLGIGNIIKLLKQIEENTRPKP